ALLIDFRSGQREPVPLPAERMSLVVLDSQTRHELRSTTQRDRVAEARSALVLVRRLVPGLPALGHLSPAAFLTIAHRLPEVERRRVRHVVTEVARVLQCRDALAAGDLTAAGHLLNLSHASSRNDYETSTPRLDLLQEQAASCPEVYGARLCGGGFGGCVVALVAAGCERAVVDRVSTGFERAFGVRPGVHRLRPVGGLVERAAGDCS
ncbi:MAG: galactokinase, partial [Planctomycetota bacterium]